MFRVTHIMTCMAQKYVTLPYFKILTCWKSRIIHTKEKKIVKFIFKITKQMLKALQLDQLTSFIQFQSLLYNFKFPHIKYPMNFHQYMWWRSILHKDAHICASNVHYVSNDQDKAFGLQILFLHVFTCDFANSCKYFVILKCWNLEGH
jgi:hypothetical protein